MIDNAYASIQVIKGAVLLALLTCFLLNGAAVAAEEEKPEAEYSSGSRMCLACHGEGRTKPAHEILLSRMGSTANPAAPMAEGNHGCEACHGPSKAHTKRASDGSRPSPQITFRNDQPADIKNGACLTCHDSGSRFHWMGSMHDIQQTACVDCHDLHVENDPVLATGTIHAPVASPGSGRN
jgi:hypothetical protein